MREAALIYNPISGRLTGRRRAVLAAVAARLEAGGVTVRRRETDGPGSAAALARAASEEGCDTVVVCGGDGTVHQALQGLVGTGTALGVVPFGTANALAASLGLAGDPVRAAERLLSARPVRIPVGVIGYRNRLGEERERYFLVAAGVGPDAQLMAEMDPGLKRKLGYLLYLLDGFRIWADGRFPLFAVRIGAGEESRVLRVSQLLAVRIHSFGGALGALVPGASLRSEKLHLLAFATQSRWEYLRFVAGAALGRHPFGKTVELIETDAVECAGEAEILRAEADGEPLGTLPVRMAVRPDALTLLAPEGAKL